MKRFIILFFTLTTLIFSRPEKFDHMQAYKQKEVSLKGPKTEKVYNLQEQLEATAVHSYNKLNQLVKSEYFIGDKKDGYTEYSYNNDGLIGEKLYNKDKLLIEIINYQYDKKHKLVSYSVLDANNKIELTWNFTYDGSRINSGVRKIDKKNTEKFRYLFGKQDISQIIYNSTNKKVSTIKHKYDNGLIQNKTIIDNTGYKQVKYSYDKNKRMTEIKFFRQTPKGLILVKKHHLIYNKAS